MARSSLFNDPRMCDDRSTLKGIPSIGAHVDRVRWVPFFVTIFIRSQTTGPSLERGA